MPRVVGVLWFVVFCSLLSACNHDPGLGKPTSVSGKVTVDGQPLSGGTVNFFRTEGGPADFRSFEAKIDASGEYKIGKIYPGEYRANVQPAVIPDPTKESAEPVFRPVEEKQMDVKIGSNPAVFDFRMTKQKATSR